MQGAAGHGVWAEEDVDGVPGDEGEGDGKPYQGKVGRGVRPICASGAARRRRLSRKGLRGGRRGRWGRELGWVVARGDHDFRGGG